MKRLVATLALIAPLLPSPAPAQTEEFGPWLVTCTQDRMTDRNDCRMLHRQPVEPSAPGQTALTLEVMDRGGKLVPVVTARDLTLEGAGRGILALTGTAQLRFPPKPLFEMPCGLEGRSVICAPREADLTRAAAELPMADRVRIRMTGLLPGEEAKREPVELRLSDTAAALSRYRAQVPEGGAPPAPPGFDLRDILSRLMRWFNP